jgi:hypothetical protein
MVEDEETGEMVWAGPIPHDFGRRDLRNMVRAGVPEKVAMGISEHNTRSVLDRCNMVNEANLARAAKRLSDRFERETQASMGILGETRPTRMTEDGPALLRMSAGSLELARGIKTPTCDVQS